MQLTHNQQSIKNAVVSLIQTNFQTHNPNPVWFTAPTGAGKTFIVSKAIEEILLDTEPAINTAVLFFTLSQANLPHQIKNDFTNYYVKFNYHHIAAPSKNHNHQLDSDITNLVAAPNCVYIFGIDALNKNSILWNKNHFDLFVDNLTSHNQRVLVVWDEAHIRALNQNNKFQFQVINLIKSYFPDRYLILKMTATIPLTIKDQIVKMPEHQATDDHLIKSTRKILCDQNDKLSYLELIDKGLTEFKQIKQQYRRIGTINPAVLIQISTKKACQTASWQENWTKLQQAIEAYGLTWCLWTSDKKELSPQLRAIKPSLEYLAKADCEVDVIIFIYALATGWDIPRACMLMQLTELQSKQLTQQTIGRIRRNPTRPLTRIKNTIYDQYVLYTNLKQDKKLVLNLKESFRKTKFYTLKVDANRTRPRNESEKTKSVTKYLNQHRKKILHDFDHYFNNLHYQATTRSITSWQEQYRTKTIVNLLQLAKMWTERLPVEKLRTAIEKWSANSYWKSKPINYKSSSFPHPTNWEWYLFWLNHKHWLKSATANWKSNYQFARQITIDDLLPPVIRTMEERGLVVLQSKTAWSFEIDSQNASFFPYTSSQALTQIWLDSGTEQIRVEKWFKVLKQLQTARIIKQLQFTCKNFVQLNISYQLWDSTKDRESSQHPDLIAQFNQNGLDYTLLIEIKSQQHNHQNPRHPAADYETRIKMIRKCYPQFAKKLTKQNYVFILDLTTVYNQQAITYWHGDQVHAATNIEQCLSRICSVGPARSINNG